MTRALLEHKIKSLNELLGRPRETYSLADDSKSYTANVGCLFLEHNTHYGYKIVEIVGKDGGERVHSEGLTLREARNWVSGAYWMHKEISG